MLAQFYDKAPLLIYCDPSMALPHIVQPHDTVEHLRQQHKHRDELVAQYRAWAIAHAHIIYRVNDDADRIVHFATDFVGDIAAFHRHFGIAHDGPARSLPDDLRKFRIRFLAEELCEYAGVTDTTKRLIQSALDMEQLPPPLEDQFDALIDLVYVALGTAHMHGFPFAGGWARVHRANMTKVRAVRPSDSKRDSTYDVVKPEGWTPPRLNGLLEP